MIRHGFSPPGERTDTDSLDNINTVVITRNNGCGVIIEKWEKLEDIGEQRQLNELFFKGSSESLSLLL